MNLPFTEWNSVEIKCVHAATDVKCAPELQTKKSEQMNFIYADPKKKCCNSLFELKQYQYDTPLILMEKMHNTKGNSIFITRMLKMLSSEWGELSYEIKVKWIDATEAET